MWYEAARVGYLANGAAAKVVIRGGPCTTDTFTYIRLGGPVLRARVVVTYDRQFCNTIVTQHLFAQG